jgi:prophage regulatory protein
MSQSLEGQKLWRLSQLINTPAEPEETGEAGKPAKPAKPGKSGILGISRTSFYRLLEAGKFPKPVRPLPGIVAWREADVAAWLKSHVAG